VPSSAVVDGLVAWYRTENTNNDVNTVVDATNNLGVGSNQTAFTGTNNGASFVQNSGARDVITGDNPSGAYNFDGVDDKIVTTQPVPFDTGSIALTTWVRLDAGTNDFGRVFGANDKNDFRVFVLTADVSNKTEFLVGNRSTSEKVDGPALSAGSLTHLALTSDGETLTAFINGSSVGTTTVKGGFATTSGSIKLAVGATVNRPRIKGVADDSRLYNRSLSGTEINQIYQNTDPDQ
jgi:hypothetical protein